MGEVHSVNVNVGALESHECSPLDSYVGTVLIYQDTYHEASYRRSPHSDPKERLLRASQRGRRGLSGGCARCGQRPYAGPWAVAVRPQGGAPSGAFALAGLKCWLRT